MLSVFLIGAAGFWVAARLAGQASFFRTRLLLSCEGFDVVDFLRGGGNRGVNIVNVPCCVDGDW